MMTKEEVLKHVEQRLGVLNTEVQRAVDVALDIIASEHLDNSTTQEQLSAFVGRNPPWEAMTGFTLEERSRIMQELEQGNKAWLETRCQELGAMWLLVVDGHVLRWGSSLGSYVTDEEKVAIGTRTGKFPLYYEADWSLLIEETGWHATGYAGDAYPTLPLHFLRGAVTVEVVADFDTGGMEIYADAGPLQAHGIVTTAVGDIERSGTHLGKPYRYVPKPLEVRLTAADGTQRTILRTIRCLLDWRNSPFVLINPHRAALVGRLPCLDLQPTIVLDFTQRKTIVQF